jgi:hypothetical protein
MGWYEISRVVQTKAGASGTVTFPTGTKILQIIVLGGSGATVTLPDGQGSTVAIPIPSATDYWTLMEHHTARALQGSGAQLQIAFASTTSYFVEYILLAP